MNNANKTLSRHYRGKSVAGNHPYDDARKWGWVIAGFTPLSGTNLLVQISKLPSDFMPLTHAINAEVQ